MSKKMVDLLVLETSGVDHPAHLHEGFAVMKSADPQSARAIFAALGKDTSMGTNTTPARPAAPASADAIAKAVDDAVTKAIDSKLQPVLDQIASAWKDLRAVAEQADAETPSTEGADPAAAAAAAGAAPVLASAEEFMKSAPEAVRVFLEKAAADTAAARKEAEAATTLAKAEQGLRLDAEAIQKSKSTYTNMALDHDTVAPAIRALGVISPDLQKAVESILVSANAQLDGAAFTKEFGTASRGSGTASAMAEVNKAAGELVASGQFDTIQKAKAYVFETDTALTERVRQETSA